jgi:type IV pilus assembly protein PilN
MRITLNLASRPFADLGPAIKRLRIGMGVLALLSILLGFGLHAIHRKAEAARARDHSLDGQIARITQEREGYQALMRQPPNAELLRQAGALNKLIDEKTFSWTLAIEDLETVLPGGVQVTNLEPARQKDGHITLKLRIIGPRNRAVDLVRNLEHSRRFLLPRIIGEDAETLDRPSGQRLAPVSAEDRVQFELLAEYNPATPADRAASKKTVKKSADSEESPRPAAHPIHPLPLRGAGQGRTPYSGPVQPAYPGRAAPGAIKPGPGVPPRPANPQPNLQPNSQPGGPQ